MGFYEILWNAFLGFLLDSRVLDLERPSGATPFGDVTLSAAASLEESVKRKIVGSEGDILDI